MVYRVSSRPARAVTQRSPVSGKKKKKVRKTRNQFSTKARYWVLGHTPEISALGIKREKDQRFKVIFDYTVNSRLFLRKRREEKKEILSKLFY